MKKENLFIIILAMLLSASCEEYAEPETFLIPEGYTGVVVIVFDQQDGTPMEHKEGGRIYRIPERGILYTQFSIVDGILDQKLFYVNEEGEKVKEIKNFVFEESPKPINYILDEYDGSFSNLPEEKLEKWNTQDYPKTKFIYLTVGKPSVRDSLRGVANKLMNKISGAYPEKFK